MYQPSLGSNFLHVSFKFKSNPSVQSIKDTFNEAEDWINYLDNNWIIKTDKRPQYWYDKLKRAVGNDDNIFIVKIDLFERQGFLPKSIWEWIRNNTPPSVRRAE